MAPCPQADRHTAIIMLEQRRRCSSGSSIPRCLTFFNCLTMKTVAPDSSETLVTISIYQSTWCNIPQVLNLHQPAVTTSNLTKENCCHVWYLQRESKTHIKRSVPDWWLTHSLLRWIPAQQCDHRWDFRIKISQLNNGTIHCNQWNLRFWD